MRNTITLILALIIAGGICYAQTPLKKPKKEKTEQTTDQEAARKRAEARKVEEARKAEEERQAEAARKAEEERKAEKARKAVEAHKAEVANKYNGHDFVDLGLPSGIKWATCNVGATKPEGYGNYYAWGETRPKASYDNSNCPTYVKDDSWLRSNGYIDSSGNLTSAHDAARQNWGSPWRMPTKAEIDELINYTDAEWTTYNGVDGCLVTSKRNGNSIFFPAAGWHQGSKQIEGYDGTYWTATRYESRTDGAHRISFDSHNFDRNWLSRFLGYTVRPVAE